jgi:DNA-directed RNA polymerase specialized sigma24 family protein
MSRAVSAQPRTVVSADVETGTFADLARRAHGGDRAAWAGLVRRYVGLVHAVCRCYGLGDDETAAVNQVVWLSTAEHLPWIRSPEAIGGWIAAVARNECLRVLRARGQVHPGDEIGLDTAPPGGVAPGPERVAGAGGDPAGPRALLDAFAGLDAGSQRLLRLLVADPRPGHDDIGAALDLPVDAVGPARDRSLAQLRMAMDARAGGGPVTGR